MQPYAVASVPVAPVAPMMMVAPQAQAPAPAPTPIVINNNNNNNNNNNDNSGPTVCDWLWCLVCCPWCVLSKSHCC